jgi:Protein of unknown function (DUF3750)
LGKLTKVHRRLLNFIALAFLLFFVLPLSLRAVLYVVDNRTPSDYSYDVGTADMASIGLLPAAETQPAARLLIMSVPMSGKRGQFLTHSWVVLKPENARSWSRYDVLGFASRDGAGVRNGEWLGNRPVLNRYAPDGRWFGRSPVVIVDTEGKTAAAAITKITAVIENYETLAGHYRFWPGPNSNTFVAAVLRAAPELRASLPPTAIGRDFRPSAFFGLTDSRTGVEADLLGIVGLKVGWIEGLEINLFSFVAGLDLRQPALKLPGFGQIDFEKPGSVVTRPNNREVRFSAGQTQGFQSFY